MHMRNQWQKVLNHLRSVRAPLLQLPHIRSEFKILGVDRPHDGIDLISRLDAGSGMLMKASLEPHICYRRSVVVQGRNYVGTVFLEVIGPTRYTIGRQDSIGRLIFLHHFAQLSYASDLIFSLGRVEEIAGDIRGPKRNSKLYDEGGQQASLIPVIQYFRKRLKRPKALR